VKFHDLLDDGKPNAASGIFAAQSMKYLKDTIQMLAELDALYNRGWRDGLFIVDDNFIGNKKKLKSEVLPAIIEWRKGKKDVFSAWGNLRPGGLLWRMFLRIPPGKKVFLFCPGS
jgi:hypothetical protein